MRLANRRDATHAEIQRALKLAGWTVYDTSRQGGDFPDLVIGARGRTILMECKTERRRESTGQRDARTAWTGDAWIVARSGVEAVEAVAATLAAFGH